MTFLGEIQLECPRLNTGRQLPTGESTSTCLFAGTMSHLAIEVPDKLTLGSCNLDIGRISILCNSRLFRVFEIADVVRIRRIESDGQLEEVVVV